MTEVVAIKLELIDLGDGTTGVCLLLPEDPIQAIGMTVDEATRFIDAFVRITKTAHSHNEALAHGAVGPTQ